jgi:outer membrane protein OmpA-like peptidoglycan-associated protein
MTGRLTLVLVLVWVANLSVAQTSHPVFGVYHPRITDNIDPRIDGELTIRPDPRNTRKAWVGNVVPGGLVLAMMSIDNPEGNRLYDIPEQIVGGQRYPKGSLMYTHDTRSIILSIGEGEREISFMGDRISGRVAPPAQPPTQTLPQPPPPLTKPDPTGTTPTPLPTSTQTADSTAARTGDWAGGRVPANVAIRLENVHFELSKAVLLPESYPELDKLARLMQTRSTLTIRLEGHTDILGDPEKNRQLSLDRVVAVKKYLTTNGIAARRIQTKGYGDTRPLVTGGTVESRRVNRRVEFVVQTE